MSLPSTTRDYRPEIDGLRAVSVLAVAFFHAKIPVFSGGFVGVDIFFVISGFLITKIIWNEILEKRFSLLKFYERRARRILPALFVVVIFVIIFTILFKTPREARLFGESISFFGLFASNFFFLQERGYFEAPLEQFALLHTWSLAVEEQFYIFFPLILMALGSQTAGRTRTVVWALAGASFVAASILVFENRNMVFFSTPFRLWELALGSLLALGAFPAVSSRPLREALSALGAALIVVSVFAYDETLPFPGAAALAPCAGAALIIHANQNAGAHGLTLVGRGLAWGPVVFIGLVSYSFYLWHWPALSFAQYVAIRPLEPAETAGALALSFLLAVASLHLIERPFRRPGGVMPRGPLLASSALGLLACIGLGIALQESKGWPGRMPPDVLAMTTGDVIEMGVDRGCLTERDRLTPEARENVRVIFCRIGDVEETPKTLVWGDSHTLAISPAFDAAGKDAGRSLIMTSRAACPPITGFEYYPTTTWPGCVTHNQAVLDSLERLGVERVLLFAAWGTYSLQAPAPQSHPDAPEPFRRGFAAMIERLQEMGVEVVIGTSVPVYKHHVPSALSRAALFGTPLPHDLSRSGYERRHGYDLREIAALSERYGVEVFALHEQFCDDAVCEVARDGLPLYADASHINIPAARALASAVAPLIK